MESAEKSNCTTMSSYLFSSQLKSSQVNILNQGKVAEQEKLLRNSVRKHCLEAEKMSVWERIFTYVTSHFTFEDDECKEFMEAMLVNPLVTVNPLQVI